VSSARGWDLVIAGGTVVDGTGAPARAADVAVAGGRIAAVGDLRATPEARAAHRTLDAGGLVVTPGFIDIHTHYDAQLHFEPTASPSSWHGATTVFTGNCGFTFAPAKPDDVPWLLQMLSRVEGMSADALAAGVTFAGGSFADFLAGLRGRVGVNVAANVGHCALRRWVMGDDAAQRRATAAEIAAMQQLLREALADGAVGFTSSQLDIHVAHDGRPVPSNLAAADELVALASVLGETGRGAIEFIPRSFLHGYDDADRALIRAMATASGRPVHTNTISRLPHAPDGWSRTLEFAEACAAEGVAVHPMFATNRQGAHFSLDTTFLFDEMPVFRDALVRRGDERVARLRDPQVREAMRAALADWTGRSFVFVWEVLNFEVVQAPEHEKYLDRSVAEVAGERGQDPLDCFLDVSLAEDLRTQFVLAAPPEQRRQEATATLLRSPHVMAGSSDAGAHLLSFCGADFTTRLLTEWVPDVLSFEAAVAKLTSIPAATQGLPDRGVVREGAAADLLLIDRARLATSNPRLVTDFPAGAPRYVIDAVGYVATIVNGEVLLDHGVDTGARPGAVIT
jgi:N-acyl-D-aspartate/D-glutamate deacylase